MRHNSTIQAGIETITPIIAQQMLENNAHNRKPNVANINKIVKALEQEEWQVNGQSIVIDSNGAVGDGQHRLMACMQSGISFDTVVVRGTSPKAFTTIDIGKNRSAGDVLGIDGVNKKISSKIASVVLKYRGFTEERITRPTRMSNTEVLDTFNRNQSFYLDALDAGRDYVVKGNTLTDVQWAVAFLALFDLPMGIEYLDAIRDENDSVLLVLEAIRVARKMGKMKDGRMWVAIINGYNYYVAEEFPKRIDTARTREGKSTLVPIIYPQS